VTQLLISFCFTSPPGHALAKFDTDSEVLEWIKLDQPGLRVYGGMGICRHGDGYIVIFHAVRQMRSISCIGELDRDLRLCRLAELQQVSDGHSVVEHDGALLVVSSGTNQVIRVVWPVGGEPEEDIYFELEPGHDTLHMNSLRLHQGKLYLSMFGPRRNGSWHSATEGQVLCLDDRAAAAQGIHHPHGLFALGDELLCVGSMSGAIRHVAGPARAAFPKLDGYLRGVAGDSRYIYVGTSRMRERSKSSGDKVRPLPGMAHGIGCGLHMLERDTLHPHWLDLSPFAAEIYDIHILPPDTKVAGTRRDAMLSRLHALNGYSPHLLELAKRSAQHVATLHGVVRTLIDEDRDYRNASQLLQRLLSGPVQAETDWHLDLAFCKFQQNDLHAALHQLELALGATNPELLPLQKAARASLELRDFASAVRSLRQVIQALRHLLATPAMATEAESKVSAVAA
jgi:hypothetical protein